MKIYVCETAALARSLIAQWGEDKVIDLGSGPWEDVTVEERNHGTPNKIWDYSGLNRFVLVLKD